MLLQDQNGIILEYYKNALRQSDFKFQHCLSLKIFFYHTFVTDLAEAERLFILLHLPIAVVLKN